MPQRINCRYFYTLFSQFSQRSFFLNVKLWSRLKGVCAPDEAGESVPRPWWWSGPAHHAALTTAQGGLGVKGLCPQALGLSETTQLGLANGLLPLSRCQAQASIPDAMLLVPEAFVESPCPRPSLLCALSGTSVSPFSGFMGMSQSYTSGPLLPTTCTACPAKSRQAPQPLKKLCLRTKWTTRWIYVMIFSVKMPIFRYCVAYIKLFKAPILLTYVFVRSILNLGNFPAKWRCT